MLVPFFSYVGLIFSGLLSTCFTRKRGDAQETATSDPGGPVVAVNSTEAVDQQRQSPRCILLDVPASYDMASLVNVEGGDCARENAECGSGRPARSDTTTSVDIDKDDPQSAAVSDTGIYLSTIQESDSDQKPFR